MFLIYPSCCARRKRKALETPFTQGPAGMMVLPVSGAHGDKKKKKKKGKNGKDGGEGVQVNLIVDPRMFGNNLHDEEEDEEMPDYGDHDDEDHDQSLEVATRKVSINGVH